MWREHQRYASRLPLVTRILSTLIVGLGMIFMPAIFNIVLIGVGAFSDVPRPTNGPQLTLAWQAVMFTLLILPCASGYRDSIFGSKHWNVFSHLPISDGECERRILRPDVTTVAFLALCTLPVYGYLVWEHGITVERCAAAVGTVLLQYHLLSRLSFLCARRLQCGAGALVFSVLGMFGLLMAAAASFAWRPYADAISWPLFVLTPAGWLNGAFYHVALDGSWWGWLLTLLAVVLLLGLAVKPGPRLASRRLATAAVGSS
ncbi:MAG: hypothetical protein KY476_25330 [Planctomycetes bacterium]|nr:hypothetical protein [Planctomycetota bacterium]